MWSSWADLKINPRLPAVASDLDRVSVLSRIAVDIFDGHNGEGQSSHVPVFCVNLELWGIIVFTFKTPCYVYYSCIQFTIHMPLN